MSDFNRNMRRVWIQRTVEEKKRSLQEIATREYPKSRDWDEEHERKVRNAIEYMFELEEIEVIAYKGVNIRSVTQKTIEKLMDKADYCIVDYEGDFVKIVEILNYPYEPLWLIYMAPVSSV